MRQRRMIAGALVALLAANAALVTMTQGARLLRAGQAIVWWIPDNAARAWEMYARPHGLHGLISGHGPTPVHWLTWHERLRDLSEPVARQKDMGWVLLGLGALVALVAARGLVALAPTVWFLVRGVGRLTPGTAAGSASFAGARTARRLYGPHFPLLRRLGLLRREPPFIVGTCGRRVISLSARRQGLNVLGLGVPGEGKSLLTINNLLHEGAGGRPRCSLLVADPKGENHDAAGAVLAARGYRVHRLDFFDAAGPGFNPLAHLWTASDALKFARSWIVNTRGQGEEGGAAFWSDTVALFLQAAILHLNHRARQGRGPQGAAPLAELAHLFNAQEWDELKDTLRTSPCQEAADAMKGFLAALGMNERLGGSILVGLIVKFAVLNDPSIARVTAHDDLAVATWGDPDAGAPTALFLVLTPGMEDVLRPLTGALCEQAFDELVSTANARPRKALARGVFCWLDEIGTVGVIAGLPRRLATLRSAGVGMALMCQDTIQLDALYGPEGRRLITTTCQCHVIFAGIGQEDAAWVSARLGTATVVGRSANAGRQRSQMLVGQGGYTRGEVGRPLMTPEEIQQMPERSIILAGLHARPVLVRSILWYKSRALRRLVARSKTAAVVESAPAVAAVEASRA